MLSLAPARQMPDSFALLFVLGDMRADTPRRAGPWERRAGERGGVGRGREAGKGGGDGVRAPGMLAQVLVVFITRRGHAGKTGVCRQAAAAAGTDALLPSSSFSVPPLFPIKNLCRHSLTYNMSTSNYLNSRKTTKNVTEIPRFLNQRRQPS